MKKSYQISKLLIVVSFGLFLTNCSAPSSTEAVDITSEIQSLNEEFATAFRNGDAAGVAARYTTDGRLYPPNSEPIEGQSAITAYWQAGMDAGLADADLTTTNAISYGDVAIEVGSVDIYAAGEQLIDKAKYIVIWKKVDGQWKMYEDIWNSSMPPPSPASVEEDSGDDTQ